MALLELLIGSAISQQVVILGTVVVYGVLLYRRPDVARESAVGGLRQFAGLFTLIIAALFLASAIGTLIPRGAASQFLGTAAGLEGVVLAGLLGGFLPGGPYAVYPIVRGIANQGATLAAVIAMLTGYGAIGIGKVPYGLVFFDLPTVLIRLAVGVIGTALVAGIAFLLI
ncbi:MAG: hypothetical protein ABEJ27_00530 [Halodesulfurarchaeum sp.]